MTALGKTSASGSSGTASALYGHDETTGGTSQALYLSDTASGSGTSYGIFVDASTATTSTTYAGYFHGKVNVEGCFQVNGTNEFGCSSDMRLKQNIEPLRGAMDQLLRLKGVTFDWKDPSKQGGKTGPQVGFIAQDVEAVFPSWVGRDREDYRTLTIDPAQLAALQVEAIRTLKADNDDLRKHVKALEDGHPVPATTGFNFGGANLGLVSLAAAIAYAASRRRQGATRA